jgi:L-ascorbate metabolism protein UlaG (beta-lactamase superfamily)
MELGFETIGNATLVVHDGGPVLVTDPWIDGPAYFGSWTRSHEIPPRQREAIEACRFVWISHGHPDHLSGASLERLRGAELLLPDHAGGRIRRDLEAQGHRVRVLADRAWTALSPRVRVACVADVNQDAVLLVDVGGRLVVNLNDAGERGWSGFVRGTMRRYAETWLLRLSGYGDADMIHYLDEEGRRIPPPAAARVPPGQTIARMVDLYGARFFVPFSSMHRYQRADSVWANEYVTGLDDYARGFSSRTCELLPAFVRVDFAKDDVERIDPRPCAIEPLAPDAFGDRWDEPLEKEDFAKVEAYFRRIEHLPQAFDFVEVRVGGWTHRVELRKRRFERGVTFEVPRGSLMAAIEWEIFDDLLIGNFMKTTMHGPLARQGGLYPDFSPYVAKYADNGGARTLKELDEYFRAYWRRDPLGVLRDEFDARCLRPLQAGAANVMRRTMGGDSRAFRAAKEAYWGVRRRLS